MASRAPHVDLPASGGSDKFAAAWRHVTWWGAGFVLLIVALAAHDVLRGRDAALAQAERELDLQARLLAEQTAHSLQAIDLVLRHVAEQHLDTRLPAEDDARRSRLIEQAVGLTQVAGLVQLDALGGVMAATRAPRELFLTASYGDSEPFRTLRADPRRGLLVGQAMPSPVHGGDHVVPLMRPLLTRDGRFDGAIVGEVRVEQLRMFYRSVRADAATEISLVHQDGLLLARDPPADEHLGPPYLHYGELDTASREDGVPTAVVTSPLDGVRRVAALHTVAHKPVALIVARDLDATLAAWRAQAVGTGLRTLALALLAAGLLALFRAYVQRLERTRESLALSQERFALAAAGADVGIWDWHSEGDRLYASARAREIFGLGPGPQVQLRSAWFAQVDIHPDDMLRRRQALRDHLGGQAPFYEGEYRVRGQDGQYRWIRLRGLCVRDVSGRPVRMAGSVTDIDASRRAADALRQSEERYAMAMAGSTGGHWVWDADTDALFVSETMNEMFGLPPGLKPTSRRDYLRRAPIHPEDVPVWRRIGTQVQRGQGERLEFEYRVLRADTGEVRWIQTRARSFRDAHGHGLRVAGVSVDITARKQTEEALRRSEERFALAVAGSNDGIIDWDIVNDTVYTSERTLAMMGADTSVTVRSYAQWRRVLTLHPDDEVRQRDDLQQFLAGRGLLREGEYRGRRADGTYGWVRLRLLCTRAEDGRPLRLTGSVSDIDAYKRVEAALRESEARYALAMTGSDEGHWVWELGPGTLFASARLNELIGRPAVSTTTTFDEHMAVLPVHAEDRPRLQLALDEHLAGRTARLNIEFRIVLPGAVEPRWLHARGQCFRDSEGRPQRVAGSTVDATKRKHAEESLRRSEERYALAVAGSDDGVWDWDFEANQAFESVRARELQGLPRTPEVQPLDELLASLRVHPDDLAGRAEALRAHLCGEAPAYACEYRVLHPDGQYRWIRVRAMSVRDADGRACRMAGSVADIDARKRAADALRESEQRFALAVAGANDGILDLDIVGDRMYVSERALGIVGLDPATPVRTRADWEALLLPRLHPDDAPRLVKALNHHPSQAGGGGTGELAHVGEYRIRHADGRYRWTRLRGMVVEDEAGQPLRWAGSISDIDDAKQAEAALRLSEERYQLAVAGSSEGLWDWDLVEDSLFLSARAQELMRLVPGTPQRPRREWIALADYHPDDVPLIRHALHTHLRGESRHFAVEFRMRQYGGTEWRWYRHRGVAIRDGSGRVTRMAGSMEDITERKRVEADRERLEAELRQAQKLEAIGTLAGGIAHDFNNILAAILGYGEMAQKDAPEGSAQRRHIDAAISAGMRAKSLVERILAFSRTGVAERVPVHVASVVAEALDLVAASLPPGIELARRLDSGDAAVLGDPTQVHQVVMNLCANAVQAMRSQGTLGVDLDLLDPAAPGPGQGAPRVRLCVRDTGSGISPTVLERIFDPFFTTKEVGVGTGLGLSLVHGIVCDLGGSVEVDSAPGQGATFTVTLPSTLRADPAAQAPRAAPPRGHGETVLLVDDEEALVRLGEEVVAELGYEPVGFTSSRQALDAFRADPQRFHAVLSDESMPEMTGSELAGQIHVLRPDLPVVLMSGYVTAGLTTRAKEAGVREVLAKPLVAADIARVLAQVLAAAAPHGEPASRPTATSANTDMTASTQPSTASTEALPP